MKSLTHNGLSFYTNYSQENWEAADNNETKLELPVYILNVDENEKSNIDGGVNENFEEESGDVGESSIGTGSRSELPDVFTKVSPGAWPIIYAYTIVFVVAAVGNLIEFVYVWRRLRKRSTAMNRLLLHLCIADILVVFMVAAVEVFWRISIGWYVGDFLCKLVQYFRAFSLYLSSLMLICLSLDRYYAVVFPLRVVDASRRVKIMLTIAWTTAAICAAPQCIVFRVQSHPDFPAFHQCNSIVSGVLAEAINTAISLSFMYFLPILVILFSYGNIIVKLAQESEGSVGAGNDSRFLRRSGTSVMDRAKIKTLKLSFVIVMVFAVCWTPYVVISVWHIVDRQSAENLNPYIQEALFIMVVANSSVNPLVYGIFNTKKNHRQRNQSTVSRNTMNESKRRTMIVRTRTSTRGDDIHPPRKQHANNAPEESPTNSDSFSQRHHQNHSLHNSGNHAVSKSPLVS